jgi:hypothetical protein
MRRGARPALAALLVAVSLTVDVPPARAAFPGLAGRIAYVPLTDVGYDDGSLGMTPRSSKLDCAKRSPALLQRSSEMSGASVLRAPLGRSDCGMFSELSDHTESLSFRGVPTG